MPSEHSSPADPAPRTVARRRIVLVAVAVAVVTAVTVGAVGWRESRSHPAPAAAAALVATTVVKRTDLSDDQTLPGTLGYGRTRVMKGSGDGLVTWLPAGGAVVSRGHQIYRVDDRPVPLFYGDTPLFRTLKDIGTVGRDVRVVADNLRALGYDIGSQPAVGTYVAQRTAERPDGGVDSSLPTSSSKPSPSEPPSSPASSSPSSPSSDPTAPSSAPAPVRVEQGDGVLTYSLVAAIKRWQTHTGLPGTGPLGPGDVVVVSGEVRVGSVTAEPGDPVTEPLLSVTSTVKQITVPVDSSGIGSIRPRDKVTVTLPDNSTAHGTVKSIGTVVQSDSSGDGSSGDAGGTSQQTVTVTLDDASSVRGLQSAPVQVSFTSETRKGVLAVPVDALIALNEGGYAVQLPDGRLTAVKTGMFAKGLVEVSGSGVSAGLKVVTAS
ncbi:hypothetical protein [Streptomyces sp. NPDC004270]